MKIIEALKKIKDLTKKAEDIRKKIADHSADLDCEAPVYPDQKRQISEWLQAHSDIVKEILSLRYRIQKTNVMTPVTIEIGEKHVTKHIAEWIHRRRDLAALEKSAWDTLNEKNLQPEYKNKLTTNSPETIIKRRLYYDPKERDTKREIFRSEPSIIDGTMEVINAVTDLLD